MTYLACLAVGFLAGFTGGFRVAAMIWLGVERAPEWVRQLRRDHRAAQRENRQLRRRLAAHAVDQAADGSLPQEG